MTPGYSAAAFQFIRPGRFCLPQHKAAVPFVLLEVFGVAGAAEVFVIKLFELAAEEEPADPASRQPRPAVVGRKLVQHKVADRNGHLLQRFVHQLQVRCSIVRDILLVFEREARCGEFVAEPAQPVAAAHGARPFSRNPEEIGDDHTAARIQEHRHLCEHRVEVDILKTFAEQQAVVFLSGRQVFENALEQGAAVEQLAPGHRREIRARRDAVDFISRSQQHFGVVAGAAADVENASDAFRNPGAQEFGVEVLRLRQVFKGDGEPFRPEAVMKMVGFQEVTAENIGDAQSDFLRIRIFALAPEQSFHGCFLSVMI